MKAPTEAQQGIIKRMADGDYPDHTFGGWFWADDAGKRISKRSLDALVRHGWLDWRSTGRRSGFGIRVELSQKAHTWLKQIEYEYFF